MAILLAFAQSVYTVKNDMDVAPVNQTVRNVNKYGAYVDTAITAHSVSMIANVH